MSAAHSDTSVLAALLLRVDPEKKRERREKQTHRNTGTKTQTHTEGWGKRQRQRNGEKDKHTHTHMHTHCERKRETSLERYLLHSIALVVFILHVGVAAAEHAVLQGLVLEQRASTR